MKGFAALATAAILVVQIAALLFVSTVSAAHTVTITPDRTKVKEGWAGILTLNVANAGPAAIKSVQLYTDPASLGWSGFGMLKKIPKDNIVSLVQPTVVLPAGTVLELRLENDNIILPENSLVLLPYENQFVYGGTIYTVKENVKIQLKTEAIVLVTDNENARVKNDMSFSVTDLRVKLLADTKVVLVSENTVRLPENVLVQKVAADSSNIPENLEVLFKDYYLVTLPPEARTVKIAQSSVSATPSLAGVDMMGSEVSLVDNLVYIPPTTPVKIQGQPLGILAENENVLLLKDWQLDVTGATIDNVPSGWSQDPSTRTWSAIADNQIAANASENFPFAITAPTAAGNYTFYVWTVDTAGEKKEWPFQITVDNSITVNITVDKTWVGKNENITITVKSDEPFWFDNVFVIENNAPENVRIEMSTTDNMTYTGVYTTGENENRDGYLTIIVLNARDEVGNTADEVSRKDLVFVDRRPPAPPALKPLGIPAGEIENKTTFAISTTLKADHDNLVWVPGGYSPENLVLEVLVDNNVVQSQKASATGLVSFTIELREGKHTIGARIIDKAGNVGAENVDNVYVDVTPPSITVDNPTKGALFGRNDVPENKIKIRVRFRDTVLGIENVTGSGIAKNYKEDENFDRGYAVVLYKDGQEFAVLAPSVYPTVENAENIRPDVFGITAEYVFENVFDLGTSPEGKFNVVVYAGDSMFYAIGKGPHRVIENIAFEVDISPPAKPSEVTGTLGTMAGTSVFEPTKTSKGQVRLIGKAEPRATIQVWTSVEGGAWTELSAARTTADEEGNWSTIVDLTANKGKPVGIKIRAVDKAGNGGEFYTYGYVLFDDSRPIVKIKPEHKQITTDKASVLIEGTIQIDGWETYDEITVRVSPSTAAINFDRATGKFTVSAPVTEGTNLITVEAVDLVGNTGSDTAIITRTVTPWATYATILVVIALVLAAVAIFRKK